MIAVDRVRASIRRPSRAARWGLVAVGAGVVAAGAYLAPPQLIGGPMFLLGAVGVAMVVFGLASPTFAIILQLTATFLRLALPQGLLPLDPHILAFGGVLGASAIYLTTRRENRFQRLGPTEYCMVLFLIWNVWSMLADHRYSTVLPSTGRAVPIPAFIFASVVIPFTLYAVGRFVVERVGAIETLLWAVFGFAAYSAWVSILAFDGPSALVWPRYIVEAPSWDGRAVGIFNQPVVNGMVLTLGFAIAVTFAGYYKNLAVRLITIFVAVACGYSVFLTHTRVVWLAFAIVLVLGAALGRGFRAAFVTPIVIAVVAIALNWSTFTSDDRAAGGIGSESELYDRLNGIGTSLWAFQQEPITGWGIGRFTVLNFYDHKQFSPDVAWIHGYGTASHFNELGILVELGVVGLALWLAVLALIAVRLIASFRVLADDDRLVGRRLALIGVVAFVVQIICGFTVDLRLFDFPTATVMLLVGIAVGCGDRAAFARGRALVRFGAGLETKRRLVRT